MSKHLRNKEHGNILHAINANKETRTDKQDLLAISV
jgi:hypothetical protein